MELTIFDIFEGLRVISIITLIVQIVVLVCFFILVSNVSKIKNHLLYDKDTYDYYVKMAKEEMFVGNNALYREYLLRAKYKIKLELDKAEYYTPEYIESCNKKIENIEQKLKEQA